MKVLVTGAAGQLGRDVMIALAAKGHQGVGVDIAEMDITNGASVSRCFSEVRPDAVIHCAAWTAVDAAEEPDNREKVRSINAVGTKNIALACLDYDCKLVYISTDYVFGGDGCRPWEPEDERNPLNFYGQTKYEGECFVQQILNQYFIVRISWVFGQYGKNFVKTMLSLGRTRKELTVVSDQIGSPTYTVDLSALLVQMIESEAYGVYHASNEGEYISWYEFAEEIFRQAAVEHNEEYGLVHVSPVSSEAYASKAARPSNSRLNKTKLLEKGFSPLPHWKDALSRFLHEIKEKN